MISNVSRRTALKLIGVGAGGLIIGVAAASMILPGGQGRITTTVTVTETKGVTVTPTQATTPPGAVQQQGITVWGQGPEPESHYRFDNIVTAGNRVSKIVSLAGG
jgi:maltose-binding protein MalE